MLIDGEQRINDGGSAGAAHRAMGLKLKGTRRLECIIVEAGKSKKKKPWNSREYLSSSNKLADVRIWKAVA